MADSIPSQISFSKLLQHTFPGIFSALGIFMVLYLIFLDSADDVFEIKTFFVDWKIFLGWLGGLIFFGTIIGVIIDAIHHIIETIILEKTFRGKEIGKKEKEIFKDLNNNEVGKYYFIGFLSLEKFEFIIDNFYCYVECELNLSISFFFSAFIYSYFIYKLIDNQFAAGIVFFILIFLSIFCFYSGKEDYLEYRKHFIDIIKGGMDYQKMQSHKN